MPKRKEGKGIESALSGSKANLKEGFVSRMELCADRMGSVNALAKKAGIPQSTIRRYFSGGEPGRAHLVAIARAAGVSISWLASGEEEAAPSGQAATAAVDLDRLEEVVWKTRAKFKERGINLTPQSEAKVIRMIYEFYTRQGVPMDEASLENVIELAAFR